MLRLAAWLATARGGGALFSSAPVAHKEAGGPYSHTVHLPKSSLPMKASRAVEDRYRARTTSELYVQQRAERAGARQWVLHDGPPYANGPVHMGHLLNKVTKDIYNRYRLLRGERVHYVPGWDCHGLPIELKSQEGKSRDELAALSPSQLRRLARRVAEKAMVVQQAAFERWAVMADWSPGGCYRTMDPLYEASQLRVFWRMYENGLIYRGEKPVYWSPSTRTALAEAELDYRERLSPAVYVRFAAADQHTDDDVLIWTTTPWTLLANRAIAVHAELDYVVVETDPTQRPVIVAASRLAALVDEGVLPAHGHRVLRTGLRGAALLGRRYRHPLLDYDVPVVDAEHVTDASGTGLVHTAPAHGHDDWLAGRRHGLEVFDCVDDDGRFVAATGERYAGLDAYSENNEGSQRVVADLRARSALFAGPLDYRHRYPYDWRTGRPVVVRSTAQWFASVDDVRALALHAIADDHGVTMLPDGGRPRLQSMLAARNDWCISRQRVWGVPIPVFYHPHTGAALIDEHSVRHLVGLVAQHGSDCWWWMPVEQLLPPEWLPGGTAAHVLAGVDAAALQRCTDTMDVWFDSGTSWAHVLAEHGGVADLVFEGSDQHRGWFQSLLLTHVGASRQASAPYRTVVTHGFVLDDKGRKMSKSLGNVVDPEQLAKDMSIDGLRLWVACNKLSNADVLCSQESLDKTVQLLRRVRNTLKFLLGNVASSPPSPADAGQLMPLDRLCLHQLAVLAAKSTAAYDSFNISQAVQLVAQFIPNVASQYFESVKDRLYCDPLESPRRRACVYVMTRLLDTLLRVVAPIMPYTVEEVHAEHRRLDNTDAAASSAFAALRWFDDEDEALRAWHQPQLDAPWERLLELRSHVNRTFEQNPAWRLVRSRVTVYVPAAAAEFRAAVELLGAAGLVDYLGAADVRIALDCPPPADCSTFVSSPDGVDIHVGVADLSESHTKCPRCYRYTPAPMCPRCADFLADFQSRQQ